MSTALDDRMGLPSASKFEIIYNCPGQPQLLKREAANIPAVAGEPSEAAERGTRIHKARETGDTSDLRDEQEQRALERWLKIEAHIVERWIADRQVPVQPGDVQEIKELRLFVPDPDTMQPMVSARVDVIHWMPGIMALVVDGKTGRYRVGRAAADDWQLRIAAIAARYEFGAQSVRVALILPEASREKESSEADYWENSLRSYQRVIKHSLWLSEQPGAELRPGRWCQYCLGRFACPEASYSLLPASVAEDPVAAVQTLTPQGCAAIWRKRKIVESILGAVEARLAGMADDSLSPLGLRHKPGRRTSKIEGYVDLRAGLLKQGFTEDELNGVSTTTLAKLVPLIAKFYACSQDAAEAWLKDNYPQCIEVKQAEQSLAEL